MYIVGNAIGKKEEGRNLIIMSDISYLSEMIYDETVFNAPSQVRIIHHCVHVRKYCEKNEEGRYDGSEKREGCGRQNTKRRGMLLPSKAYHSPQFDTVSPTNKRSVSQFPMHNKCV